jgi:hypothetical protein
MAHVEHRGHCRLRANTTAERALLGQAARQGYVVLADAHYLVRGAYVLLPERITARGAERVRLALEAAAAAHAEALRRRRAFHLVEE